MARNQEVIRQWQILRTLDARRLGVHIDELARELGVSTRTIRRDLDALVTAGFPVYDERRDRRTYWRIDEQLFRRLSDLGLSLPELSALYFGRKMLESLVGPPFRDDVRTALDKIARILPSRLRAQIDRLPQVFTLKADGRAVALGLGNPQNLSVIVDAILAHRRLELRYYSMMSRREKRYVVEPLRLVFGQGALYLRAHVPEYGADRTFAVNRIRRISPLEETFDPGPRGETDPFRHSLGVFDGSPIDVVLEFSSKVAPYIRERVWHPSQTLTSLPGGRLRLGLRVSDDVALRMWVLGFGCNVRVVAPESLAQWMQEELEEMRTAYAASMPAEGQPALPFEAAAVGLFEQPPARASAESMGVTPGRRHLAASRRRPSPSSRPVAAPA